MSDACRYAVRPDPRSRSWDLETWKFDHFQNVSPPRFQCQLASDYWLLNYRTISKFDWAGFLIFCQVFVSRDFEVHWSCKVASIKKRFLDSNEIWYVGRGRWVMHDGMPYDPIQGQVCETLKVRNSSIFKMCLLRHFQWELANNCSLLN